MKVPTFPTAERARVTRRALGTVVKLCRVAVRPIWAQVLLPVHRAQWAEWAWWTFGWHGNTSVATVSPSEVAISADIDGIQNLEVT